jgi:uncharacterized SAM-binding protein YcdF (DUF218 family)
VPSARFCVRLVVALLVWELVAWGAGAFLVARSELASADMLVLLSGAPNYTERAQRAAELWHEHRAPRILLTNDGTRGPWSQAEQRNPFFYERTLVELQRAGVPTESVYVLPPEVSSTYDEAIEIRKYAEANGIRSVLVVTSAYHSRRALWTYRRVFNDSKFVIGMSPAAAANPAVWWLTITGWRTVPVEYVKLIYYWIHYR